MAGPRPVLVVGAGGHAREILDALAAADPDGRLFEVVGVVSKEAVPPGQLRGRRLATYTGSPADHLPGIARLLAIGDGTIRRRLAADLGGPALSVVHPAAVLAGRVDHGEGLVAAAGASVAPAAALGHHVHLNCNAVVETSATLGDFVTLSPGASVGAAAVLGEATFVGAGARVLAGVRVGGGCVVGAGAVVEDTVADSSVVVGRPARPRVHGGR
jgi:sugar O-acyltransferase (sialic acid O-acetyltransferase NeuD family)